MVKEIDDKPLQLEDEESDPVGEKIMDFDLGERLRTIREMYGLSQRALAKRTGVANGLISMIELNRTSPSVATLKKILSGFPLRLADFFAYDHPVVEEVVYPAKELVELGGGGLSYRQVGTNMEGRAMQILHERMDPDTDTGEEMLRHESEEGGVVISGKIEITVGGQTYVLGPGDGYYFDSRIPHRFRNIGDEVGEIVSCCSPPSF